MKLLNIDDLIAPKRVITIGGEQYAVAEKTVGQMLNSIKLSEAVDKEGDPEATLEAMVGTVQEIIPTCPREKLNALTIEHIVAIMDFVNAPIEEMEQVAAEARDESEKKS